MEKYRMGEIFPLYIFISFPTNLREKKAEDKLRLHRQQNVASS